MNLKNGINPQTTPIHLTKEITVTNDILMAGLTEELAAVLRILPLKPRFELQNGRQGIWWRCDFAIPNVIDPQHPAPYYRLQHFLNCEAPETLGTGWRNSNCELIYLATIRKGSWMEVPAPEEHSVWFYLSIQGGDWPLKWGGAIHLGNETIGFSPNRLLLVSDAHEITVVQRHVECMFLFGQFKWGTQNDE